MCRSSLGHEKALQFSSETRWNSVCTMVKSLLDTKSVLINYLGYRSGPEPTTVDARKKWEV
jgi:hypothetical protein